jgi:hypothetical protein
VSRRTYTIIYIINTLLHVSALIAPSSGRALRHLEGNAIINAHILLQMCICLCMYLFIMIYFLWLCSPALAMASFTRFLDHTQRRTTVGTTPLDECSYHRRDLYLTTHTTNIHAPVGIRTHDRSGRVAVDLRLRPRDHWDRHLLVYIRHNLQTTLAHLE